MMCMYVRYVCIFERTHMAAKFKSSAGHSTLLRHQHCVKINVCPISEGNGINEKKRNISAKEGILK